MMPPRLRAALIHFAFSLVLGLAAAALAFFVWYPAPLAKAVGLLHVFLVLIGVDAVLGPTLTFLVYKVGKKSLRFDISMIVLLQLAAFFFGFWKIAEARPAWLVFNMDRFDVAQAMDLDPRHRSETALEYRSAPWSGAQWVASRNPTDRVKHNELMFESAAGGPDLPQRIDLYEPLAQEIVSIQTRAKNLDELNKYNTPGAVKAVLLRWPQADAWLPLAAREEAMTVLLDRKSARVIAVVDLRPWD